MLLSPFAIEPFASSLHRFNLWLIAADIVDPSASVPEDFGLPNVHVLTLHHITAGDSLRWTCRTTFALGTGLFVALGGTAFAGVRSYFRPLNRRLPGVPGRVSLVGDGFRVQGAPEPGAAMGVLCRRETLLGQQEPSQR